MGAHRCRGARVGFRHQAEGLGYVTSSSAVQGYRRGYPALFMGKDEPLETSATGSRSLRTAIRVPKITRGDGVKINEPFGKSKSMFELLHKLQAVQKTGLVEFGLGRRWASKSLLWARSAGL